VPVDGTYYVKSTTSYVTCPDGFYCLHSEQSQSYTKFPCPPGTYTASSTTGSTSIYSSACSICPAGSYCPGGASGAITCPAGYICPAGTQFATQFPCPLATMNPNTGQSDISACVTCTAGMLCLEGTANAFDCPPGDNCGAAPWLSGDCPSGEYSPSGACLVCPAGMWCPTASSYPMKCPSGTYTSGTGG
jgi:hypothetical protein